PAARQPADLRDPGGGQGSEIGCADQARAVDPLRPRRLHPLRRDRARRCLARGVSEIPRRARRNEATGLEPGPHPACKSHGALTRAPCFRTEARCVLAGGETGMKTNGSENKSASQLIDARIKELGDWRGQMLSRLRALVKEADPDVVEEWKWRGVPVWSHDGLICTGETYKSVVKM